MNAVQPVERPINQWSNKLPQTTVRPQSNLFERPSLGPLRAHQTQQQCSMIWAHTELTSHCFERPQYNLYVHRTTTINHYLQEQILSIIKIVWSLSLV